MSDYQGMQETEMGQANVQLDAGRIKQLLQAIYATQPDELSCDDCFELADRYAELVAAGADAAAVLPLVHDHLDRCPGCRQEFEALIRALQALNTLPKDL